MALFADKKPGTNCQPQAGFFHNRVNFLSFLGLDANNRILIFIEYLVNTLLEAEIIRLSRDLPGGQDTKKKSPIKCRIYNGLN